MPFGLRMGTGVRVLRCAKAFAEAQRGAEAFGITGLSPWWGHRSLGKMCPIQWPMSPCALLTGLDGWDIGPVEKPSPAPRYLPQAPPRASRFLSEQDFPAGPTSIPLAISRSGPALNPVASCTSLGSSCLHQPPCISEASVGAPGWREKRLSSIGAAWGQPGRCKAAAEQQREGCRAHSTQG